MNVRIFLAVVAVLAGIGLAPVGAGAIQVEDLSGDTPTGMVAFFEGLTDSIQTGVVKTGLIKGFTWEEKGWGAFFLIAAGALGFVFQRRRKNRWRIGGVGPFQTDDFSLRPFSFGQVATQEIPEDSARAFRA